jgi:DNA protecting protein DprA
VNKETSTFAIFRLLRVRGLGPARLREILEFTKQSQKTVLDLTNQPHFLRSILAQKHIDDLSANYESSTKLWLELIDKNVSVLSYLDDDYPELIRIVLGADAPILLFLQGNRALLNAPSLGFCGSRKATPRGTEVAKRCAEIVSQEGVNVVSGYASGVDLTAHRAALESGGTTTAVLAEGLLHFRVKRELRDIWDSNKTLIVSEFMPAATWNVGNAMRRNKTICALCKALVLIEARERGGSMEAGRTCLSLGIPLFAPVYQGMPESARGNQLLLHMGARTLYKNRTTNLPNLRGVLTAFNSDQHLRASSTHTKIAEQRVAVR